MLNLVRIGASDMQVHRLVALLTSLSFDEARTAALNLHTASGLALNVLDIGASMAYNLCAQVEASDGFEIDGNALFWPFALQGCQL